MRPIYLHSQQRKVIDTNKIQIKDGMLDSQKILKAWESFNGDYFFALEDKGDDTYYGLVKTARNETAYLTVKQEEIEAQKMWRIKDHDLSLVSFELAHQNDDIIISTYTAEQAEEDGILVRVPEYMGPHGQPVYITQGLYTEGGYEDEAQRKQLVKSGFDLLKRPDKEDRYSDRKLRVIEKGEIWVIEDGSTVTFLKPDEY